MYCEELLTKYEMSETSDNNTAFQEPHWCCFGCRKSTQNKQKSIWAEVPFVSTLFFIIGKKYMYIDI